MSMVKRLSDWRHELARLAIEDGLATPTEEDALRQLVFSAIDDFVNSDEGAHLVATDFDGGPLSNAIDAFVEAY